ncbi:MAG: TRAP transporter substrate-binding protein [Lachnospiraceae bacterium]
MLKNSQRTIWTAIILGSICLTACAGYTSGRLEQEENQSLEFVFTYAENQPNDYPTTKAAQFFADLVKERSEGRIQIVVEADGVLGDESSVVKQVCYGGIDFARVSIASITDDISELKVLMLPYLYRNSDHMWNVLNGEVGKQCLQYFSGSGMRALSWYDAGARNLYTREVPIHTPEDLEGLTIRVQPSSDMMNETMQALGAETEQYVYADVYGMLERGFIDGAENNVGSYVAEKHYLQAKYYTMDEHVRIPEVQLISEETWNKLSEEDQTLLAQCAMESARYERDLWEKYEMDALQVMEEAGCQIIYLSAEERRQFEECMSTIYENDFPNQRELIEQIRNVP